MQLRYLTTFIIIVIFLIPLSSVFAQNETIDPDEIREKIKERLEKTVLNDSSNSKESTSSAKVSQPSKNIFGYFGTIKEASNSSLILYNPIQRELSVKTTDDTVIEILRRGRTSILEFEDIEKDWFAIAIGELEPDRSTLVAKRISLTEQVEDPIRKEVWVGKIKEVDEDQIVLTEKSDNIIEVPRSYTLKVRGVDKADLNDVNPGDKAIVAVEIEPIEETTTTKKSTTASPSPKPATETYTLKVLYVIPSVNNPLTLEDPEDTATESGEASPSGKKTTDN